MIRVESVEGRPCEDFEATPPPSPPRHHMRQELHRAVLQEAFIGQLRSDIRLDRPEAKLPETLAADGARLAAARDDADRVTLVATLGVLLRQVLLGVALHQCAHRGLFWVQCRFCCGCTASCGKRSLVFCSQVPYTSFLSD